LVEAPAWRRVLLPLDSFSHPSRFGRMTRVEPLDWADVARLGFSIQRPYLGPFRLYVREIGLYR
jgi:hypothetical protein